MVLRAGTSGSSGIGGAALAKMLSACRPLHRASVRRIISQVYEQMEGSDDPERKLSKARQQDNALKEKLQVLRTLDSEILELAVADDDAVEEITQQKKSYGPIVLTIVYDRTYIVRISFERSVDDRTTIVQAKDDV